MFWGYCGKENAEEYSFCSGCGKPLDRGKPGQTIQPKDTVEIRKTSPPEDTVEIHKTSLPEIQNTENYENSTNQSDYISVTFWKYCEWPWQARSLDGENLLGAYGTELEAAKIVAKFHGITVDDLFEGSHLTEDELLRKKKSLIVKALEKSKSRPSPVSSDDISNAPTKKSLSTEDFLSFDSPWPENFHSGHANKQIPVLQKKDASPKKSPPTQPNISEKIKEAVEGKEYYIDQFIPFYETGKGIKPWNWAAFLIGPFWCLYRKVYSLFFVYTISYTVMYWAEKVNMSDLTQLSTNVLWLFAWIQITIKANRTYYNKVLKRIKEIKQEQPF